MCKQIVQRALILSLLIPFTTHAFDQSSPPNSLVVTETGMVGIGTDVPTSGLELQNADGKGILKVVETNATLQKRLQVQLENNGPTGFSFKNAATNKTWQFATLSGTGGASLSLIGSGGSEFVIRNDGRIQLSAGPAMNFDLSAAGDLVIPNGTVTAVSHISSSSRSVKKDFKKVRPEKVMKNIKAMEVTEWRYKDENSKGRHIGPMAEDFYEMFGLGPDNKHVAATDMASIALIAAKELQKENETLKERLASLEKLVLNLASGQDNLGKNGEKIVLNK